MNEVASVKHYLRIALALLGLLVVTVAAAYLPLGPMNTPVALLIALAKAALILMFFMHMKKASGLVRLFAFAGVFWLGILMVLALSDYLTRH